MALVSLAGLHRDGRPAAAPVALGPATPHARERFRRQVAGLCQRIRATSPGRWLLHCDDGYAFVVGFFALAHAGRPVLLPPNRQPGTLARLRGELAGALLDPGPGEAGLNGLPVWRPLDAPDGEPDGLDDLDPDEPRIHLSTSGTTGEGKWIAKALRHLDVEVTALERCFGERLEPDTPFFATVSQQHIYGLLFRVLWPLAAGRPFAASTYLHAEELLPRLDAAGAFALVSTPAHLSRAWGSGAADAARAGCRAVFSSGGPLAADTARAVARALGAAPIEVLGSTETGGIAWRSQGAGADGAPWTPLPGVQVASEPDGRLAVASPFVSVGEACGDGTQRFVTGDRAVLRADGRLELRGRADRVVKIGEKRLALPEMESQLRAHAWVADAALCGYESGSGTRVGAVVVLADAGREALAGAGRRGVSAGLVEHLAPHWDRVLLPRAWRYADALPRDEGGKLPLAALRERLEAPAPPVRDPVELAVRERAGSRELDLAVPPDLAYLEGHYAGFPLVAGVVQLGWAVRAALRWRDDGRRLRCVEALKFKHVLRPGDRFRLSLEAVAGEARVRFRLDAPGRVFSEGRLVFDGRGEPRA